MQPLIQMYKQLIEGKDMVATSGIKKDLLKLISKSKLIFLSKRKLQFTLII